jgi:hypothetical protein
MPAGRKQVVVICLNEYFPRTAESILLKYKLILKNKLGNTLRIN